MTSLKTFVGAGLLALSMTGSAQAGQKFYTCQIETGNFPPDRRDYYNLVLETAKKEVLIIDRQTGVGQNKMLGNMNYQTDDVHVLDSGDKHTGFYSIAYVSFISVESISYRVDEFQSGRRKKLSVVVDMEAVFRGWCD